MTTPARHGQPWTMAELRRVERAYAEGMSAEQIAEMLGRTRTGVIRARRRHGLTETAEANARRQRGDRYRSYALAMQLRRDGLTWEQARAEVARQFGYGGSWSALEQGCRAYRKALQRPARDAG